MELFKRILLSLFPETIVNQPINPASMFISFVNPKQFFSVINRKIVENYKLNLYDIALDSFEAKIGFGDQPSIKLKQIDFYYSYGVVANLNGYRFLSPSNLGNSISMVCSIYLRNSFNDGKLFLNFLITIYLLTFLFLSRIKVFPFNNEKDNYKWFIDILFEFYWIVLEQTGDKINKKVFYELKNNLLKNLQLFFMLFHFYQKINKFFESEILLEKEFYNWLFYDELKKGNYKYVISDFIENYSNYRTDTKFTNTERKVINLVFPADILIRYLFESDEIFLVVDNIICIIYDKNILDEYINSFFKNGDKLEQFIEYITNYNLFKENFFKGLKKLLVNKFSEIKSFNEQQDIEDIISMIGNSQEGVENFKIPERIKKESVIMERLINFYITFIGGFWNSKGDNFYIRYFRNNILNQSFNLQDIFGMKQDNIFFYGGMLYTYSKNVFYYKFAFENVREGKEKFNLPFKSNFKELYSNMFILKLFNEGFISTVLQDINEKDIKIYLQNKEILECFKEHYLQKILNLVRLNNVELINSIYQPIINITSKNSNFLNTLINNLSEKNILSLKDSIYSIDFWFWISFLEILGKYGVDLESRYSDIIIIGIISFIRDSIFGFMLYYYYLFKQQKNSTEKIDYKLYLLKTIYIEDILGAGNHYYPVFNQAIEHLINEPSIYEILDKWIKIDNNEKYLNIGMENWLGFVENKEDEKIIDDITGEDLIWLRGYLKNITFYNKRFLIPKD